MSQPQVPARDSSYMNTLAKGFTINKGNRGLRNINSTLNAGPSLNRYEPTQKIVRPKSGVVRRDRCKTQNKHKVSHYVVSVYNIKFTLEPRNHTCL